MGDTISRISLDIDGTLLEDLAELALKTDSDCRDLIYGFIEDGLNNRKGVDNMLMVGLNENVVEKVNIKCKLSNKTPDEVVNDVLWEQLCKIEDVSEDFDGDKLWNMLDHDKPEGDDILDRITDMFD
nr:hypothetical protein [uncultured Methanobrevibacter sp.]